MAPRNLGIGDGLLVDGLCIARDMALEDVEIETPWKSPVPDDFGKED